MQTPPADGDLGASPLPLWAQRLTLLMHSATYCWRICYEMHAGFSPCSLRLSLSPMANRSLCPPRREILHQILHQASSPLGKSTKEPSGGHCGIHPGTDRTATRERSGPESPTRSTGHNSCPLDLMGLSQLLDDRKDLKIFLMTYSELPKNPKSIGVKKKKITKLK